MKQGGPRGRPRTQEVRAEASRRRVRSGVTEREQAFSSPALYWGWGVSLQWGVPRAWVCSEAPPSPRGSIQHMLAIVSPPRETIVKVSQSMARCSKEKSGPPETGDGGWGVRGERAKEQGCLTLTKWLVKPLFSSMSAMLAEMATSSGSCSKSLEEARGEGGDQLPPLPVLGKAGGALHPSFFTLSRPGTSLMLGTQRCRRVKP